MMKLTGSIPAVITPFTATGDIDYPAFARLIDWHVEQGSNGLVIAGTTGESATLSFAEHEELIDWAVRHTNKRLPLIAGTGANATAEAIALTAAAKAAGIDACLLVTPYYNKPNQAGLYAHFHAIATAVDIPLILYNVPSRTSCDMQPETTAKLSQLPNIIGIKETNQCLERLPYFLSHCHPDFLPLTGEDGESCEFILAGGKGVISVTANIAPNHMHKLTQHALNGEAPAARALNAQLQPLHQALFIDTNPIPVKFAAAQQGHCQNTLRLPLLPLDAQHHQAIHTALAQL